MVKAARQKKPEAVDRFYRFAWIVVVLVPFLVFLPALRLGFVYFDDDVLVLENQAKIAEPGNLGLFFTTDVFLGKTVPYYRPMLNVALMFAARAGGTDPGAYHFLSILLHCLVCLVFFRLLKQLGFSPGKQLAGALLFSLHPLLANAVFWVPALNDLLIALFGLLSFSFFLDAAEKKSFAGTGLHLLFFAAALFSKESAVVLPVICLVALYLRGKKFTDPVNLVSCAGWILIVIAWYFLRRNSTGVLVGDEQGIGAIVKNIRFLPEILARFFLPWDLAIMPVFSIFYTVAGVAVILAGSAAVAASKERNIRLVILGLAWFLAFAVPNMFLRQFNTPDSFDYLEHRAYMPAAGLMIFILACLPERWMDLKNRAVRVVIGCLLALFAVMGWYQSGKYRNAETYWESVLSVSPDRAWFHHFYGRYWFTIKDFGRFEEQLKEANRLKEYGTFQYNLGMIELMQRKNYEAAYACFVRAIDKGETKPEVIRNFVKLCIESSAILDNQGKYTEATRRVGMALKYEPANTEALMNLALYMTHSGDDRHAVSLWRQVLGIDPTVVSAWKNLDLYYNSHPGYPDSAAFYHNGYLKSGGQP